jgi:predicted pyridoxine 5'-phosphate oxidase superfamily flavin-nucleotide-binding protein
VIPEQAKPSMQGADQSVIATCNRDGTPNITSISQVWYVDSRHVAVSFQFFTKTAENVRENPYAAIRLFDPDGQHHWSLDARFVRAETEGHVFDEMEMQLEAIASMTGMTGVFKLRAAHIYEVLRIERLPLIRNLPVTSSSA